MDAEPRAVSWSSMWLIAGRSEPLAAKAPALFELVWRAIDKPGA